MNNTESILLKMLLEAADAVAKENEFWANHLRDLAQKGQTLLSRNSSPGEKLEYARSIESIYGGMGSFNDLVLKGKAQESRNRLYATIQNILREYWLATSNEHHNAKDFVLIPVGTVVKMARGKKRYIERDGSAKIIPDMDWVDEQTWIVEAHYPPDITNMPMYSIKQGSKHSLIRHEAIVPIKTNRIGSWSLFGKRR